MITGKAEKGKIKVGQDIEVVGYNKKIKSKVTGERNKRCFLVALPASYILRRRH